MLTYSHGFLGKSTTTASAAATATSAISSLVHWLGHTKHDAGRVEWYTVVQGIEAGNARTKCLRSDTP